LSITVSGSLSDVMLAQTLDQDNWFYTCCEIDLVHPDLFQQTVTAGVAGQLSGILVEIREPYGNGLVTFSLYEGAATPSSTPVFTEDIDTTSLPAGEFLWDVSSQDFELATGDVFTFGLAGVGEGNGARLEDDKSNKYSGGELFVNGDSFEWSRDLAFRTYLREPSVPLPFFKDFNDYEPSVLGTQPDTGRDMYHSATFSRWGGFGDNHSYAVDVDPGPETDFAVQLFGGTSWQDPNTLTLKGVVSANRADTVYQVSFDSGPTVWDPGEGTDANSGLPIEILRSDYTVLARHLHRPGGWSGALDSQDLTSKGVFTYRGDGTGSVRIRLAPYPTGTGRFAGAIDNLQVSQLGDFDELVVPVRGQTIPLGNLFDDPKLTDLASAIATDTYGAIGDVADLGVAEHGNDMDANGGLGTFIAPGISFDLSTVGGDDTFADNPNPVNDAALIDVPGNPPGPWPIRTTGRRSGSGPGPMFEPGIGMHSNQFITFDLDEIRAVGSMDQRPLLSSPRKVPSLTTPCTRVTILWCL
jgi:hypothetical protein